MRDPPRVQPSASLRDGEAPSYRRLRVDGHDAAYLDAGDGPETVVLLHGFGGWSQAVWTQTLNALSDRFRVVAPDLLGFGLTAKPPIESAPDADPFLTQVRFLERFLGSLGVASAAVVGHSFGGALALRYTLENPDRVTRLGLVASMGMGRSIHHAYRALALPFIGRAIATPPTKPRIRLVWEFLVQDKHVVTDALVDRTHEILSEPGALEVLRSAQHGVSVLGQRILFEDALFRIAHPTLVAWGRHDRIFPVAQALRAARRLPRAELALFECGHIPSIECPDAFNARLRSFLTTPEGGPAHAPTRGERHLEEGAA